MPVTSNDFDTKAGRSSSSLNADTTQSTVDCLEAGLTTTDAFGLRDNTWSTLLFSSSSS